MGNSEVEYGTWEGNGEVEYKREIVKLSMEGKW